MPEPAVKNLFNLIKDFDGKGNSKNWFIFSLNYKPDDKVTISPNVVIETYK